MSFEHFIAKRILKNEVEGTKVSRPIVRISILSISLAVVVNLITLAIVTGFQHEVRKKVSGFGSHIFIMNTGEASIYECNPINKNQAFLSVIQKMKGIKSINATAYKPVLFQSDKNDISYKLANGKDTSSVQQEIQGAIIKGVGIDFNWKFFKENLKSGKLPNYRMEQASDEILISDRIARDLHFKVGDEVRAFFVRNQPLKRFFKVVGIYDTGLEEFDKKIVIGDIRNVQQLNDWGISSYIEVEDSLTGDDFILKANVNGGNGNYRFDWGNGYEDFGRIRIFPTKDTLIRLISSDYWNNVDGKNEQTSIPDTSYLKIKVTGNKLFWCMPKLDEEGLIQRNYLNEDGTKFSIDCPEKSMIFEQIKGKGSYENYVGGYEINVKNWEDLPEIVDALKHKVEFIPTAYEEQLKVTSIIDNQGDIFVWLGFLDLNVVIIVVLMIIIGIINMGSALLVLILVRSNFIGMMKAMGATNWSIRKIFLFQAAYLIGRGMIWGNVIGLTFCFIQSQFGIFTLNPEVYYLDQVPIELNFWHWLFLNVGTLLVCVTALIIPSYVITRITPVKAIKFN
ncbi:MAG: ABC transporter permease [Flavobacteriia bacterium]|nr:ABC transporter permease [Flavobacteriia bacterium]